MISKRTLIVGYSASGIDIARQVVRTCQLPLYVSQGTKSAYYAPLEDTLELPEVVELNCDDRSAVFSNGCRIQTILLQTREVLKTSQNNSARSDLARIP